MYASEALVHLAGVNSTLHHACIAMCRDSFEADGSALEPSAPLSLLVNRGTASASEVWHFTLLF